MVDLEKRLRDYRLLCGKITSLTQQSNLLREQMDTQTELLLETREYASEEYKQQLVKSLQESERVLLQLIEARNKLALEEVVINSAVKSLPHNEKKIVIMYYYDGMEIADIAAELSYSYSWTHKLKAKALLKLIDLLEVN